MNIFKRKGLFVKSIGIIMSFALFSIQISAEEPTAVGGRVIEASSKLGDDSSWMEIAKYKDYSLILRVKCLPEPTEYNIGGKYNGYIHSNVSMAINKWFYGLKSTSDLKRFSVGSTALANLGYFAGYNQNKPVLIYSNASSGEAKGTGFSLPEIGGSLPAFALSYQEVRKFIGDQYDIEHRTEPSVIINYCILKDAMKEKNKYLFGLINWGETFFRIQPSWLRTPGTDKLSVSCNVEGDCLGRNLVSEKISSKFYVRPAMWVRSSIFEGISHPMAGYAEQLSTAQDNDLKTKIEVLLLSEKKYRYKLKLLEREPTRLVSYHIATSENPDLEFVKKIADIYCSAEIISKNQVTELSTSDISKLEVKDFEKFLRAKLEDATNGVIFIDCKKVFDTQENEDLLKLRFEKLLSSLSRAECLAVVTNCPDSLKNYAANADYYHNLFEILDAKQVKQSSGTEVKPKPINISECLKPLDLLVGMDDFKKLIKSLLHDFKVYEMDAKIGVIREKPKLHMILMGNPGTGKTTVAQMLGDILFKAGIIKKSTVVKVERADLVGKYQGHTEAFVKDKLKEAEGGILFIDEAYSLTAGGSKDFGQRAIEGLLTPLTTNDCVIIVAGYTNEMHSFLKSNSGLNGRFAHKITLKDYTSQELLQIFENLCLKSNLILEESAKGSLLEIFENATKDSNFSNARYAHKIYDCVMRARSMNLPVDINIDDLSEKEKEDIRTIKKEYVEAAKEEIEKY